MPEGQSEELWRRRASSFGAAAAAYAEHRPDYSADAVSWLLAGAEPDVARALDLAAGTGAVTGTLLDLGSRSWRWSRTRRCSTSSGPTTRPRRP